MFNVLIVEDHDDVRAVVRTTLDDGQFEVFEACNGVEGIKTAAALRPDLVFLDVNMPGKIDGFEVCSTIKRHSRTRHARIVMLTARCLHADLHQGRLAGCDAYVMKPFSPDHLLLTAHALMRCRPSARGHP
jgi:CheY-like chemotaxis protein